MTAVYDAGGEGDRRRAPSGGVRANTSAGTADRFLHVCYCCSAEVRAEVCSQFVDQLAFRHVMSAFSEEQMHSAVAQPFSRLRMVIAETAVGPPTLWARAHRAPST